MIEDQRLKSALQTLRVIRNELAPGTGWNSDMCGFINGLVVSCLAANDATYEHRECDECGGRGRDFAGEYTCPGCEGSGYILSQVMAIF